MWFQGASRKQARMAPAVIIVVCSLSLAKNAMRSPTSIYGRGDGSGYAVLIRRAMRSHARMSAHATGSS